MEDSTAPKPLTSLTREGLFERGYWGTSWRRGRTHSLAECGKGPRQRLTHRPIMAYPHCQELDALCFHCSVVSIVHSSRLYALTIQQLLNRCFDIFFTKLAVQACRCQVLIWFDICIALLRQGLIILRKTSNAPHFLFISSTSFSSSSM